MTERRDSILRSGVILFAGILATVSLLAQSLPSNGAPAKAASPLAGQSATLPLPQKPLSFGLNQSNLSIPVDAFSVLDSGTTWTWDPTTSGRYRTGGSAPYFHAPVNLPSGAHIYTVAFEVADFDAVNDISSWIVDYDGSSAGNPSIYTFVAGSSGSGGWGYIFASVDITVDNFNHSYALEVSMASNAGLHILRRASIYYTLQVSPAPVTATFTDVPLSDPGFQYIEALVASGITAGCGGGNYCPDNPLTRRQMAVFFSKALGLYWPN